MKPVTTYFPDAAFMRLASHIALATAIVTLLTFAISIATPPRSGPWCEADCFTYPYHDIASRFPRDYWWMVAALIQLPIFAAFIVCIYLLRRPSRELWSMMSLFFGLLATATLFLDYFVQLSVVQQSLEQNEFEGIALISQFNPHGIFLALEDAGYTFMSLAMFFAAPLFTGEFRFGKALRALFASNFALTVLAFALISLSYGIHREYRFEIAVISITWLTLIAGALLLYGNIRSRMATI